MRTAIFSFLLTLLSLHAGSLLAQDFQVQLAAYHSKQPDTFFINRGFPDYIEIQDRSGIFWYLAGRYENLEIAEAVHLKALSNGFKYAFIIDEAEQQILADADCPYIKNGVVFIHDPSSDPAVKTIYFDFGKASLSQESRGVLDGIFEKLQANPNLNLQIQGYTDGVGDARSNMQLAATRSRAARDYLIYKGIRADRMLMEVFGEATPAAPNAEDDGSNSGKGRDLPENRKWNRRVTLTLKEGSNPSNKPK